jgi:glucan biosynthesis protein C
MPTAPIAAASRTASGEQRLFGLDWLRALASVLVVVFHAGIPYMAAEFPGLVWCIDDAPARSAVIDAVCWNIDTFIMPLFFLMSGFLACQTCRQSCPLSLTKCRAVRLGIPFLFAALVVLPIDLYVWLTGWVIDGRISIQKLLTLRVGPVLRKSLEGVAHLWFLEYLLVFCVGAALIVGAKRKLRPNSVPTNPVQAPAARARLLPAGLLVVGCFLTSALGLFLKPQIVIGFRLTYFPHLANVLYYAPCFALGWLWSSFQVRPARATGLAVLAAAAGLFFAALPLIAAHVAKPETGFGLARLVVAFIACGWLAAFGWFTLALNSTRPVPPAIGYVCKASLWIYLVHHPICGLTQIALRPVEGGGVFKAAIVTATALVFCLLTYEAVVRNRLLDRLLNGIQRRPRLWPAAILDSRVGGDDILEAVPKTVAIGLPTPIQTRKRGESVVVRRPRLIPGVRSGVRHRGRRERVT